MGRSRAQSSVGAALDIVADQWTLLIIRDLFAGVSTWKGLSDSLVISPATLKRRLDLLIAAGCVTRNQEAGKKQVRYKLTTKGFELFPFLMAAREWQLRWDARPEARVTNWHHSCGQVLRCTPFCRSCGEAVRSGEVVLDDKALPGNDAVIPARRYRYVPAKPEQGNSTRAAQRPKVVDVLGESRTTAVMAALLRGIHRFDAIQQFTGLPPATVSSRLRRIQLLGLGHTRLYQENPDRALYQPSAAGRDLLSLSLQLMQWGNKWLAGSIRVRTQAIHRSCGQPLESVMRCEHCHTEVTYDSVTNRS
ncbi:MAG: winged helix-turn-helix transcriptional regulator [Halieaceae bacterium]